MDLRVGERLKNLSGDIVWVQQKLPRPGPTPVYNLEVLDEHVYYFGANGVLAHNVGNDLCKNKGAVNHSDQLSVSGDVARSRLRSAFGLERGNVNEGHHLIPWGERSHGVVERAARGGYNFNGLDNGVVMPFDRHRGVNIYHHDRYNTAIRKRLDRELLANPNMTDVKAAEFLRSYTNRLRAAIQRTRGRLR